MSLPPIIKDSSLFLSDSSIYCHTDTSDQIDLLKALDLPGELSFKQPSSNPPQRRKSSVAAQVPTIIERKINIAPILAVQVSIAAITTEDFYLVLNVRNVTGTRADEPVGIEYVPAAAS